MSTGVKYQVIGSLRSGVKRSWRISLLALLCVAGSQLALAGHQFLHDDVLVAEHCAVCVQAEQHDVPVPVLTEHDFAVASDTETNPPAAIPAGVRSLNAYLSRAPPAR